MKQLQCELPFAEYSLDTLAEKAIRVLRYFQPTDRPYRGCTSGGKDSIVIMDLCASGNINVEWHYNVTKLDPPEVVRFIRKQHPYVIFDVPKTTLKIMAIKKGIIPTRAARWCCEVFKESADPPGSVVILGVRAEESQARAKRWQITSTNTKTKIFQIAPILYWRKVDIWKYIKSRNLPYCSLYDEGWKRLGCVGCPMTRKKLRMRGFARWPVYEKIWRGAIDAIYEKNGSNRFRSADEWWQWWLQDDDKIPPINGCAQFFEGFDLT